MLISQIPKYLALLILNLQKPWVEALLILNGAASVTTLEYHEIESRHPKVKAVMPDELSRKFLDVSEKHRQILFFFLFPTNATYLYPGHSGEIRHHGFLFLSGAQRPREVRGRAQPVGGPNHNGQVNCFLKDN